MIKITLAHVKNVEGPEQTRNEKDENIPTAVKCEGHSIADPKLGGDSQDTQKKEVGKEERVWDEWLRWEPHPRPEEV